MLSRAEAIVKAEGYLEVTHHDSIWNLVDETDCVTSQGIGRSYIFIYLLDDAICLGVEVFAEIDREVCESSENNFRWNPETRKVEWGYFGPPN